MNYKNIYICFVLAIAISGCGKIERPCCIEGQNIAVTAVADSNSSPQLRTLLEYGRTTVDSMKSRVIGSASMTLKAYSPESPLMNFAADALLSEAQKHSTRKIDIAVTNKGGLRSDIKKGVITYGDVCNVFPFENKLVILSLNGEQLLQLFSEIAQAYGQAISGARIGIQPGNDYEYDLVSAKVGGKKIDKDKVYTIATSDYLAQGNDGLHTLAQGFDKETTNILIRDLMVEHISLLHKNGKAVSAKKDKRIKEYIVLLVTDEEF